MFLRVRNAGTGTHQTSAGREDTRGTRYRCRIAPPTDASSVGNLPWAPILHLVLTPVKWIPQINYYLEKRDPDFEVKMAQILLVYKEIEMFHEGKGNQKLSAILSYDEKPGIQAIENLAPDLMPKKGKYQSISRDHQYKRHGTMTLMAGINLLNGIVHGQVVDRHRSKEFIDFLNILDHEYDEEIRIRIILDNHSAHLSKETKQYLATVPNRFEFIFTPTHGSWLNIIESFFAKMTKTLLRGIRVKTKEELKIRILKYLDEINQQPVIFKWKYGLDALSVSN